MKLFTIVFIALCAITTGAIAKSGHSGGGHSSSHSRSTGGSHSIAGHTTKKGTYVAPTRATNPDNSKTNNYSHKGNVNPSNGKKGTKE